MQSRSLAGVTVGAALAVVTAAAPAYAEDASVQPRDTVPSCVDTYLNDDGGVDHLWVTNNCADSVRVKVVLAWAPDFACTQIDPGVTWHYQWPYPGRFDGLEAC